MTDLHQQIADLEAEVDNLSDAAERCRKTMILAKIATGVGVLGLSHRAVPVSLAMSLFTVVAAIPTRLGVLSAIDHGQFMVETIAVALGAVIAAYFGVGWIRRLSSPVLGRLTVVSF